MMFWIQLSVPSSTAPTSVGHEQDEQQQRAGGTVRLDADDEQQHQRDGPREPAPDRRAVERVFGKEAEDPAELILEEQADQHARHGGAENADLAEHFADAQPFGRASDFGKTGP